MSGFSPQSATAGRRRIYSGGRLHRLAPRDGQASKGRLSSRVDTKSMRLLLVLCLLASAALVRASAPGELGAFIEEHCAQCHDADNKKGGLDLDALPFDLKDVKTFGEWIKI